MRQGLVAPATSCCVSVRSESCFVRRATRSPRSTFFRCPLTSLYHSSYKRYGNTRPFGGFGSIWQRMCGVEWTEGTDVVQAESDTFFFGYMTF